MHTLNMREVDRTPSNATVKATKEQFSHTQSGSKQSKRQRRNEVSLSVFKSRIEARMSACNAKLSRCCCKVVCMQTVVIVVLHAQWHRHYKAVATLHVLVLFQNP